MAMSPTVLVEATFLDDHDPGGERTAHHGRAILATPTQQAAMDARIALVPLTVRLYPEGVGTARPGG